MALSLAGESKALFSGFRDTEGIIHALINEGFAEQSRGSAERSARVFCRALALSSELGHKEGLAVALEGLAGAAVSLDLLDEAARLLGRSQSLREEAGFSRQTLEDHFYQSTVTSLRYRLSGDRLEEKMSEGARMNRKALSDQFPELTAEAEQQHG